MIYGCISLLVHFPTERVRGMERRGSREWRPKGHEEKNGPLVVDHWWSPPPHLSLPLSSPAVLMFCSFLIANTTTRSDYVESLHGRPVTRERWEEAMRPAQVCCPGVNA